MKKTLSILTFLLLLTSECFSQGTLSSTGQQIIVEKGIGFGSVLAIVISWSRNKSIITAILHGVLSWFYVIYFIIVRKKEDRYVAQA